MWVFCNSVIWGFCREGYCRRGFCRWGFCRRGFCHVGFLSWIRLHDLTHGNIWQDKIYILSSWGKKKYKCNVLPCKYLTEYGTNTMISFLTKMFYSLLYVYNYIVYFYNSWVQCLRFTDSWFTPRCCEDICVYLNSLLNEWVFSTWRVKLSGVKPLFQSSQKLIRSSLPPPRKVRKHILTR